MDSATDSTSMSASLNIEPADPLQHVLLMSSRSRNGNTPMWYPNNDLLVLPRRSQLRREALPPTPPRHGGKLAALTLRVDSAPSPALAPAVTAARAPATAE